MDIQKTHRRLSHRSITMFLFTVPATVLYVLFFVYPVIAGAYYSLTNWNGMTSKYEFIGLKNYSDLLVNDRFRKAAWFNMRYTILLVTGIVLLSLILALILNSKIRFQSFFRGVYFFPAVISMMTVGLIFNEIFYRVLPPIGQALGLEVLAGSLLSGKKTAMIGVLIVNIWQGVAMPTVLLLAGLQNVPTEIYESAELDGANGWQVFQYMTFPFLIPILTVVIVLTVKDGLTVYDYIVALTNGGPGGSTESISLMIYNHGFREIKFAYAIAEAMVLTAVICLISFIQVSLSNRKKIY